MYLFFICLMFTIVYRGLSSSKHWCCTLAWSSDSGKQGVSWMIASCTVDKLTESFICQHYIGGVDWTVSVSLKNVEVMSFLQCDVAALCLVVYSALKFVARSWKLLVMMVLISRPWLMMWMFGYCLDSHIYILHCLCCTIGH